MECPKCNYVRLKSDQVPEWQCPSCGVAYNKVKVLKSGEPQKNRTNKVSVAVEKDHWSFYILGGIVLFMVAYFGSQDGVLGWQNTHGGSRDISLDSQPFQYYFFLAAKYLLSIVAIAVGLFKFIKRNKKK